MVLVTPGCPDPEGRREGTLRARAWRKLESLGSLVGPCRVEGGGRKASGQRQGPEGTGRRWGVCRRQEEDLRSRPRPAGTDWPERAPCPRLSNYS